MDMLHEGTAERSWQTILLTVCVASVAIYLFYSHQQRSTSSSTSPASSSNEDDERQSRRERLAAIAEKRKIANASAKENDSSGSTVDNTGQQKHKVATREKKKNAKKKGQEKGKKQQTTSISTKKVQRANRIIINKLHLSEEVISEFETVAINNDTLQSIVNFLDCKDLVNLSLTSKHLACEINKVALRMISSSNARYGGEDINKLAVLDELNRLRSPLLWNELLGNRIGYVNGDKACAYSSNPNRLHTAYYIGEQTMEGSFDDWDGTEQTAISSDYIMTSVSIYEYLCLCLSIYFLVAMNILCLCFVYMFAG